jgi:sigma-E factor negative regulatory protein RseA
MNPPDRLPPDDSPEVRMSDLADGRLGADALEALCARWAGDAACRRAWHGYQLIGDVLRSEDLASPAAHDAEFLARFRERLAAEPVVVAPPGPAVRRPSRRAWALPVAVAAGFVAVAGVLVVLQQSGADVGGQGPRLAAAAPVTPAAGPALVPASALQAQMLRDARVDDYLQMHRQALAGSPVALPGGAMRSVDLSVPTR